MIAQNPSADKVSFKKKLLYLCCGILLLLVVMAIIMPKNIETRVSQEIKVPVNYVFNLINNQQNVSSWSSWVKEDKEMKLVFDKPLSGVGGGYSWTSSSFGDGGVVYTSITPNQKLEAEISMRGETSHYTIDLEKTSAEKTLVTWSFKTHLHFPYNLMGPLLKYNVNQHNRRSMVNMEAEIIKRMKGEYYGYRVLEGAQNARHFVTVRNKVSFDQVSQFYAQNLAAIYQKIQDVGVSSLGAPCALFYSYDEKKQNTDMAVAVPVLAPVSIAELTGVSLTVQNAAYIDYYGDPAKTMQAHYALEEYLTDRSYIAGNPIIEEYVTDPLKEKDQNKWLTKIYYYTAEKK